MGIEATAGLVNSVFNAGTAALQGGQAMANAVFTTADNINKIIDTSTQPSSWSRRDIGYQQNPQPMQYQPSTYPWATQSYMNYGFDQTNHVVQGYPGITNPNYGQSGYYQTGFMGSAFAPDTPSLGQGGSAWYDKGVWG